MILDKIIEGVILLFSALGHVAVIECIKAGRWPCQGLRPYSIKKKQCGTRHLALKRNANQLSISHRRISQNACTENRRNY